MEAVKQEFYKQQFLSSSLTTTDERWWDKQVQFHQEPGMSLRCCFTLWTQIFFFLKYSWTNFCPSQPFKGKEGSWSHSRLMHLRWSLASFIAHHHQFVTQSHLRTNAELMLSCCSGPWRISKTKKLRKTNGYKKSFSVSTKTKNKKKHLEMFVQSKCYCLNRLCRSFGMTHNVPTTLQSHRKIATVGRADQYWKELVGNTSRSGVYF